MITTITLNPAFDKTVTVEKLVLGESNPIKSARFDPGGKGINVSRVVKTLGGKTLALGIIGGDTGLFIKEALEKRGILTDFVEIDQPTRVNVTLMDLSHPPATEFNDKGPEVHPKDLELLKEKVRSHLSESEMVVLAGSLPIGVPDNIYYELIEMVEKENLKAVLDTRGKPLTEGIKATPFMIKPNRYEAEQILGKTIDNLESSIAAALELRSRGIELVVLSMGKEGALMACSKGVWLATPPRVEVKSGVGAGDSMLAGIITGLTQNKSHEEAFKLGTAAGAATTTQEGTQLCCQADIEKLIPQVMIRKLQ